MPLTPIEIIALILIITSLIKIIVIAISPNTWKISVVNPIFNKPKLTGTISLILAAIVLYYLLQEINIVQILATMVFFALLISISFSIYHKELTKLVNNIYNKNKILKEAWFYILIWLVLLIWGLKEIFM
jgi:hypothetical protein